MIVNSFSIFNLVFLLRSSSIIVYIDFVFLFLVSYLIINSLDFDGMIISLFIFFFLNILLIFDLCVC